MQTAERTERRPQPIASARGRPGWTGRRVASLLAGLVVALLGLGIAGAGAAAAVAVGSDDTYLDLGAGGTFDTSGYALVSDSADWRSELLGAVGTVRFRARPASDKPIFVGVADPDAVRGYLDGVAYTTVHGNADGGKDETEHEGTAQPADPAHALDWAAQATGSGVQTLSWDADDGTLAVVAMNADGSPDVRGEVVSSEVTLTRLSLWVPPVLIVVGVAGVAGGVLLVVRPIRRARGR